MPPGPRVSRLLLLAIATGFGVSSTVQAYFLQRVSGDMAWRPGMLPQLITLNLVYWYIPALLAPAIMALAHRCQMGHVRWPVLVAVHGIGAIVYSVVHTAAMLGTRSIWFWASDRSYTGAAWWTMAQREYLTQLDWQLMTYLFFVGLGHALTYRRES